MRSSFTDLTYCEAELVVLDILLMLEEEDEYEYALRS